MGKTVTTKKELDYYRLQACSKEQIDWVIHCLKLNQVRQRTVTTPLFIKVDKLVFIKYIIFSSCLSCTYSLYIKTKTQSNLNNFSTYKTLKSHIITLQFFPTHGSDNSKADVMALSTVRLHGHSQITASSSVTFPFSEDMLHTTLRGDEGGVMSGVSMALSSP